MAWVTSLGVGQYVASETHQFWCDRDYKPNQTKRAVIWCHGASGSYAIGPHEAIMAEAGIPIMATDLGGADTWGSDTSQTRITQAWTYAKDHFGAKTDKLVLWAGSMGTVAALRYALDNPSSVAAVGCALPIVDPEDVRANDRGGYGAAVQAALGNPVPDSKRPSQNTGSYTTPIKFWTSSTDTIGLGSLADTFDSAVASCTSVSLGAVGHSYLSMTTQEAITFLGRYVRDDPVLRSAAHRVPSAPLVGAYV